MAHSFPLLGQRPRQGAAFARRPRGAALERVGFGIEPRDVAGLGVEPWRAARTWSLRVALATRPQIAAARRADGRPRCHRVGAHGGAVEGAAQGSHHRAGRARHGGGVRASRNRIHGFWSMAAVIACDEPGRHPKAGRGQGAPLSGEQHAVDAPWLKRCLKVRRHRKTCYGPEPGAVRHCRLSIKGRGEMVCADGPQTGMGKTTTVRSHHGG